MIYRQIGKFDNSDSYICYMPVNAVGFDLVLYECGYEQCEPLHYWGPAKRNFHMMHYCLSGKGKLVVNGNQYIIVAGDGFYFSPQDTVEYVADKNEPWEYIWVCFGGNLVKNIMSGMTICPQNPVFSDKNGDLRMRFEELQQASVSEHSPHLLSLGYLYILLSTLTKEFPSKKKETENLSDWFETILKIVQGEFLHTISIDKLAKQVGYSRTTLYRIFIKRTGISPMRYIECLRVSYACELIKRKELPISKIADAVGYQDYKSFARIFQKIMGVLPSEFLEEYEKDSYVFDKNKQMIIFKNLQNKELKGFNCL